MSLRPIYEMEKSTVLDFIEDKALTRGAAISFYIVTAIAPLLLILVGLAGLFFGSESAQGAVVSQLSGLMGIQTADFFQSILAIAAGKTFAAHVVDHVRWLAYRASGPALVPNKTNRVGVTVERAPIGKARIGWDTSPTEAAFSR